MTWQDYTDAATHGPGFDPTDAEIESGWPESRCGHTCGCTSDDECPHYHCGCGEDES